MKNKKGYIISIVLYILLIIIFRLTSDKFDKKLIQVESKIESTSQKIEDVKEQIKELKTDDYIKLKNGDDEQNRVVAYLWEKTKNIDLILTFYGESWLKSNTINNNKLKDGTIWSRDFGYCQLNDKYHNEYIKSNNFKIMSSQLDYCIEVYNKAVKAGRIRTTFYAYNTRYSKRVRGQFVISQEAVNLTYGIK